MRIKSQKDFFAGLLYMVIGIAFAWGATNYNIGNGARIGNDASEAIDIGFADGFRKCIANVKGVAYIGAGCRWFTLDEAIKHWESHDENRDMTLCLMQSAIHIARLARGAAPSLGGFRGISVTASAIHRAACTICTHAAPDSIRWPADRRPRGSPPSGQAGPFRAAHAAAVPSSRPGLAGPFRPLARGTAGCRR